MPRVELVLGTVLSLRCLVMRRESNVFFLRRRRSAAHLPGGHCQRVHGGRAGRFELPIEDLYRSNRSGQASFKSLWVAHGGNGNRNGAASCSVISHCIRFARQQRDAELSKTIALDDDGLMQLKDRLHGQHGRWEGVHGKIQEDPFQIPVGLSVHR